MTKHLRTVKASLIMGILLISAIAAFSSPVSARDPRPKIFSFGSYIDLEFDTSALNQNLVIDQAYSISITVKYWTDIPAEFLRFAPWQIRNMIIFGSMIGPQQQIHIELLGKPDWADINLQQSDLLTNEIPFYGNITTIDTTLTISPFTEAPAVPYTIELEISTETVGRINGNTIKESITFTPSFIPSIDIVPENPTRNVGPRQPINFKITIENKGNKLAKITPNIVNVDSKWVPTINPPEKEVRPGETEVFVFSVISPYDFGWHNEIEAFEIEFKTEVFPYRPDSVPDYRSIYLRVNNYGFSIPGFEFITLIAAVIIIGYIFKKTHSKN